MAQIDELSKREREVIKLLLQGKSNKQIALPLNISVRTVEFHLKNIYVKFHVSSRIELILKLGNSTGNPITEKLVDSTVDMLEEKVENRDRRNSQIDWAKSSINKRENTMRTNIKILRNALTGFAPGVFLTMIIVVFLDGVRYFVQNQNLETFIDYSVRSQDFWKIGVLEVFLLTSGYVLITLVSNPKHLIFSWWRSAIAGAGAVVLLALVSIFTQGANLPMIMLASLSAGMMSILFTWRQTPQI